MEITQNFSWLEGKVVLSKTLSPISDISYIPTSFYDISDSTPMAPQEEIKNALEQACSSEQEQEILNWLASMGI